MQEEDLVTLAADIVSAHVAHNKVALDDIPGLIRNVHGALAGLKQARAQGEPERKRAHVSVRASIKPDHLVCMECGRKQKTLKRHLATAHGMTPGQYRADYGLPATYPMAAPDHSEKRRALAKSLGLGRKTGGRKPGGAPEGRAGSAKAAGAGRKGGKGPA